MASFFPTLARVLAYCKLLDANQHLKLGPCPATVTPQPSQPHLPRPCAKEFPALEDLTAVVIATQPSRACCSRPACGQIFSCSVCFRLLLFPQKLILSETTIFDVLPTFFYHANKVVCMASLEVSGSKSSRVFARPPARHSCAPGTYDLFSSGKGSLLPSHRERN